MKKMFSFVLAFSILACLVQAAHADDYYYNTQHFEGFHVSLPAAFQQVEEQSDDEWTVFQNSENNDSIEIKFVPPTIDVILGFTLFDDDHDNLIQYLESVVWKPSEELASLGGSCTGMREDLVSFSTWAAKDPSVQLFVSVGGCLWIRCYTDDSHRSLDLKNGLTYAVVYDP